MHLVSTHKFVKVFSYFTMHLFVLYVFSLFLEWGDLCYFYLQVFAKMFCYSTKNLYGRFSVECRWIASQHMATASKSSFKKTEPRYPTGNFGLDKKERRTLRKRLLEVRIILLCPGAYHCSVILCDILLLFGQEFGCKRKSWLKFVLFI